MNHRRRRKIARPDLVYYLAASGREYQQVARAAGRSPGTLTSIVRGRHDPTAETMEALSRVLGVDQRELFPEMFAAGGEALAADLTAPK
jgi:transcriptional regulator with XRE-family HTH domain